MTPFQLEPVYKPYLWGGTKLITRYGKRTDLPVLAESWELSAHPSGDCIVSTGTFSGTPFSQVVLEHPEIIGIGHTGGFPILIKLIDAKQNLSVQVHPDDAYARRSGQRYGKTEMWVVLEAEPGTFLYCGFKRRISLAEFERCIRDGSLTEVLRQIPARSGDVVFIPAGTIHAIGAGMVIAEIQQNSDATYRVYDFGRLDANGNPRELHIKSALDVTLLEPASCAAPGVRTLCRTPEVSMERLAECPYFTVDRIVLNGRYRLEASGESFISLLCLEGSAVLDCGEERFYLSMGGSIFVPADSPAYILSGKGVFLKVFI